jgi:membrane protease YdiL (CAAX protease family)
LLPVSDPPDPSVLSLSSPSSATAARKKVALFLVLTLLFSAAGWILVTRATGASDAERALLFTVFTMWCPGLAPIATRLRYQRNLKGFGFSLGEPRWQLLAVALPVGAGLLMFGSAWLSGIAAFSSETAAYIFSAAFLPAFAFGLLFNLFAAAGEEIGWRGLLVPEMAQFMGFTELALLSGAIWTVLHFPLIFFSTYSGAGPLWYSLLVFVPSVIGAGLILAWLRLRSGSVFTSILFHGFWNYFIQQLYPALTVRTPASEMRLGEFGWACAVISVLLAFVFWHFRSALPDARAEGEAA